MDYSIGKVSRLLGLSIEGIRNYEKSGIISSRREEESNYRKYRYLDITSLVRARMYRSFGFSISETAAMTNDFEIPEIQEAFLHREASLKEEAGLLSAKAEYLQHMYHELGAVENRLGKVRIGMQPAYYRMEFSRNGEISFSDACVSTFQEWMEYAPFVHISSRYHDGDVFGGLAIHEKYARLFHIEETEVIRYHPDRTAIQLLVEEMNTGYSSISTLDRIRQYAQEHRFSLTEDMIGYNIISTHKSTGYRRYRQVYAPIEDEEL